MSDVADVDGSINAKIELAWSEHETVAQSPRSSKVFGHHGIAPVVAGVPDEYKITLNACVGAGVSS